MHTFDFLIQKSVAGCLYFVSRLQYSAHLLNNSWNIVSTNLLRTFDSVLRPYISVTWFIMISIRYIYNWFVLVLCNCTWNVIVQKAWFWLIKYCNLYCFDVKYDKLNYTKKKRCNGFYLRKHDWVLGAYQFLSYNVFDYISSLAISILVKWN